MTKEEDGMLGTSVNANFSRHPDKRYRTEWQKVALLDQVMTVDMSDYPRGVSQ